MSGSQPKTITCMHDVSGILAGGYSREDEALTHLETFD